MRKAVLATVAVGASLLAAAFAIKPRPGPVGNRSVPQPAKPVNVPRYMGRWYEQFRYEASFQMGMDAVSADYSLNEDGSVRVVNRGRKGGVEGKLKEATAKGKVVDKGVNTKLEVSFFRPFHGDYWVLDHGDDYEWSIVGEPSGRYLWVLTREEKPSAEVLAALESRVRSLGYDWSLVRVTRH